MNMCLIDCMIRGCCINLPYIMMNNIIMAHDKKNKNLYHIVMFNYCFWVFWYLTHQYRQESIPKSNGNSIRTLARMGYVLANMVLRYLKTRLVLTLKKSMMRGKSRISMVMLSLLICLRRHLELSLQKNVGTSSWWSRMEGRLEHIES